MNTKNINHLTSFVSPEARTLITRDHINLSIFGAGERELSANGLPSVTNLVNELIGPIETANNRGKLISQINGAIQKEASAIWLEKFLHSHEDPHAIKISNDSKTLLEKSRAIETVKLLYSLLKEILLAMSSKLATILQQRPPKTEDEPWGAFQLFKTAKNIYMFLEQLLNTIQEAKFNRQLERVSGESIGLGSSKLLPNVLEIAKIPLLNTSDPQIANNTDGEYSTVQDLFLDVEEKMPRLPIKINQHQLSAWEQFKRNVHIGIQGYKVPKDLIDH